MYLNQQEQQMVQQTCQTLDSGKGPLKGKAHAVRQWLDEAQTRLRQIHQEMESLSAETKEQISSHSPWYMDIYTITKRGSKSVRWRMVGGAHSSWAKVEPLLAFVAPAAAQWYREMDVRANLLNAREQVARYEIKTAKRFEEKLKAQKESA